MNKIRYIIGHWILNLGMAIVPYDAPVFIVRAHNEQSMALMRQLAMDLIRQLAREHIT